MFNMQIVLLGLSRKLFHDGKIIGGRFIISKRGRVNRVCSNLWQLKTKSTSGTFHQMIVSKIYTAKRLLKIFSGRIIIG